MKRYKLYTRHKHTLDYYLYHLPRPLHEIIIAKKKIRAFSYKCRDTHDMSCIARIYDRTGCRNIYRLSKYLSCEFAECIQSKLRRQKIIIKRRPTDTLNQFVWMKFGLRKIGTFGWALATSLITFKLTLLRFARIRIVIARDIRSEHVLSWPVEPWEASRMVRVDLCHTCSHMQLRIFAIICE